MKLRSDIIDAAKIAIIQNEDRKKQLIHDQNSLCSEIVDLVSKNIEVLLEEKITKVLEKIDTSFGKGWSDKTSE